MPWIMVNPNGRFEMFMIGENKLVFHSTQVAKGAGYGPWAELSDTGYQVLQLAVAANPNGRLEAFAINLGLNVVHCYQTTPGSGPWIHWQEFSTSGYQIKQLVLGSNGDGRLEAFAVNLGSNVVHSRQIGVGSGPWSEWGELSDTGYQVRQLAVGLNKNGRMEAFVVNLGGNVMRCLQPLNPGDGRWGSWGELSTSGYQVKQLVVQANLDGRLEVFAINLGDEVVHSYETSPGSDSWNGWSDFQFGKPEGKAVVQVSATIDASGRVNVVALADDTVPYRNVQEDPNGGWTGWYRDTPGSSASAHPAFHGHSQKLCHTLPRPKLVAKAVGKKAAETDPAAFKEYMVELKETCDKMCRLRVIPRSSSLSMTPWRDR